MKKNQLLFKWTFGLTTVFFIFSMSLLYLTVKHYYFNKSKPNIGNMSNVENDSFRDVIKYIPTLQAELKKYQLEKYTIVLAALMHQESQGKGGDPMQASESAGLPPNTINDPSISIKQGVKHFHQILTYGKEKQVDFPTIIQSYNMGIGYINFISKHGGKHSEVLAKKFSMIQVERNPKLYNCGGDQNNFRYPYCYGDFTYSTRVIKNVDLISKSVPKFLQKETASEAY